MNYARQIVNINLDTVNPIERGFRAPFDGKILSMGTAVNVAVTVATTNLKAQIDNVDVTGAAAAITTGRAIGYTEVAYPTALLSFRKGQYISIVGDGGGDAGNCTVTLDLQQD